MMKETVIAVLSIFAITLFLGLTPASSTYQYGALLTDDECTKEMQAACAVDLERTAKNCAKVFATDGASIFSDIKCYRDIQNDRKKCWPCLCE